MSTDKPRWADLFGMDPDYTEGMDPDEFIARNRGDRSWADEDPVYPPPHWMRARFEDE